MAQTLEDLIRQLAESGTMSPELLSQVQQAMNDPSRLDEILKVLRDLGADQMGSPTLNIADFYQEGTKPYHSRWPIAADLPIPFSQLDRKTQFFVLFQEWTRREMEGSMALNAGQTQEATNIFKECLARAQEIEVAELVARSYEGLCRVSERLGDRTAARSYSQKAVQARTP